MNVDVAVIGAGVVGSATALALARRGVEVAVLEQEPEPALAASGTNSGILHTGFDSPPGELETELILRAGRLRDPVLATLEVPVLRCGALMRPREDAQRTAIVELAANAERNGVEATVREDGALEVPGESVTDPVAFTLALAGAAIRHGAELRTGFGVIAIEQAVAGLALHGASGKVVRCRLTVNCAGLGASDVARLAGDHSFDVYPRKGEFLIFDPPGGEELRQILLPVPSQRTKGVLVFPTIDGKVVAGPTAVDQEDPDDWSVRPTAGDEILPRAIEMFPPLEDAEPIAAYAGLRPAGRDANYVIERSAARPELINVAAIRSTGLTAALGIVERVCALVAEAGVELGPEAPLEAAPAPARDPSEGPWWQRTARHRSRAAPR